MAKKVSKQGFGNGYLYFEGHQVGRLDNFKVPCVLSANDERALEQLRKYLKDNSVVVWCTDLGWDIFLNRTLFTGNVMRFIEQIKDFVMNHPSEMYFLTDSGDLTIAIIQQ